MGLLEAFNLGVDGKPSLVQLDLAKIVELHVQPLFKAACGDESRRAKARERLDLYFDRGLPHFEAMLRRVFPDKAVADERVLVLPLCRFQNVPRKIGRLVATVYAQPARRKVKGKQAQYDAFVKKTRLDMRLREANRFTVGLNEVWVGVRTRVDRDGGRVPVVDVVTPDAFTAVPDPLDPRREVAIVLDAKPATSTKDADPWYLLWDDKRMAWLDRKGSLIESSVKVNPYGRIPGVIIHRAEPHDRLLDQDSGQDIVDAQMAVVLMNVMMVHGQKVGTKVPYATGDMSNTARGQTMDHTRLTQFEEGVTPGVLDLGHDPKTLIESAKAVIAQLAANYDIPEDVYSLTHDATSGFDRQLKREGLNERRTEQVPLFRDAERELAEIGAVVCDKDGASSYAYATEGWSCDFGEVRTPQEPVSLLAWRKEAKAQLLRTTIDDLKEDNPDLDDEAAEAKFLENLAWRAREVELQRALNMPATGDAGSSPEENGGKGPSSATPADDQGEKSDDGSDGRKVTPA
jgi:hypothetical protein